MKNSQRKRKLTSSMTSLTDSVMTFINLSSSTPQSRISWTGTSPTSVSTRGSFNSFPAYPKKPDCQPFQSWRILGELGVGKVKVPSSVVELVLPHQMASLIRGGANAGPWRNDELCPKGTPRSDVDATAPPKARTSSPCIKILKAHNLNCYIYLAANSVHPQGSVFLTAPAEASKIQHHNTDEAQIRGMQK